MICNLLSTLMASALSVLSRANRLGSDRLGLFDGLVGRGRSLIRLLLDFRHRVINFLADGAVVGAATKGLSEQPYMLLDCRAALAMTMACLCGTTHRSTRGLSLPSAGEPFKGSRCYRFNHLKGMRTMNKDQAKGTLKDIAGKVQEQTGKLVGNKEQEAKGIHKQVTGKAQKHLGDVKEVVQDAKDAVKDAAQSR